MNQKQENARKFDLRDGLLVAGVASVVGGVAHFSVAVAAIVFGLMCLVVALRPAKATPAQVDIIGRPHITERQS